jgi:hypothetical protein
LVAHLTGGQGVAGSNPVSPTTLIHISVRINPVKLGQDNRVISSMSRRPWLKTRNE